MRLQAKMAGAGCSVMMDAADNDENDAEVRIRSCSGKRERLRESAESVTEMYSGGADALVFWSEGSPPPHDPLS